MADKQMTIYELVQQSFGVLRIPSYGGRVTVRFPSNWHQINGHAVNLHPKSGPSINTKNWGKK